ncbi:MAG: DUF480 domain-containing protein [Planctomycetia bacterium]|jgi:uncharacterized protein YceH (UPF0502 family)
MELPENQAEVPQNSVPPSDAPQNSEPAAPRWEPLCATDRRVVGVLIEKAKTTPDAYPLTLNALCNGCNQKSNRSPVTQLEPEEVETSLDRLRQKGAVFVVHGGGRVEKYRHNIYEWLGVSKQEIAVMAELLLRGEQTQGELRARAARMEPIASLAELQPIVRALKERGLIVPLTPEGRGHILTHNLYQPQELEKLRAKHSGGVPIADSPPQTVPTPSPPPSPAAPTVPSSIIVTDDEQVNSLQRENEELRTRVTDLNSQVSDLTDRVEQTERALRELRDALGG